MEEIKPFLLFLFSIYYRAINYQSCGKYRTMRILFLVVLILYNLNLGVVYGYGMECPVYCLYPTSSKAEKCSSCGKNSHGEPCLWKDEGSKLVGKESGFPCVYEDKECAVGVKMDAQLQCLPRDPKYSSAYPPRKSAMATFDKEGKYRCKNVESVYTTLFVCWLSDCEDRNRIPKGESSCYPPILYDKKERIGTPEEKKKYCTKYVMSVDDCFLPPICGKNGKIDRKLYVVPLIEKEDETYCEVLCPKSNNSGIHNGKPCRQRSVCGAANRYKIPPEECVEICRECNQKDCVPPIQCMANGSPPPPYSKENPFGLIGKQCFSATDQDMKCFLPITTTTTTKSPIVELSSTQSTSDPKAKEKEEEEKKFRDSVIMYSVIGIGTLFIIVAIVVALRWFTMYSYEKERLYQIERDKEYQRLYDKYIKERDARRPKPGTFGTEMAVGPYEHPAPEYMDPEYLPKPLWMRYLKLARFLRLAKPKPAEYR